MERDALIEVLGVSDDPTTGEIRRARRTIAHRLHPDAAGESRAGLMAELNAACDHWIREIRASRTRHPRPVRTAPRAPSAPTRPPGGVEHPPDAEFRLTYGVATLALMAVIVAVVIAVGGTSATSAAGGALLGAVGGGVYLLILRRIARRR